MGPRQLGRKYRQGPMQGAMFQVSASDHYHGDQTGALTVLQAKVRVNCAANDRKTIVRSSCFFEIFFRGPRVHKLPGRQSENPSESDSPQHLSKPPSIRDGRSTFPHIPTRGTTLASDHLTVPPTAAAFPSRLGRAFAQLARSPNNSVK